MKQNKKIETIMPAILGWGIGIICVVLFACGYQFSENYIVKTVTDSELESYKHVAYDVYNQLVKNALYEKPEGVNVEKEETSITVSSNDPLKYGKVFVRLQEGKLVFEKDFEEKERVGVSTFVGIMAAFVFLFLVKAVLK